MALIPLAWLILQGERRPEWWWLAGAFGISWLADTAAHWVSPALIGVVYPVSQAAIVGAVLLNRTDAYVLLLLLWITAVLAVLWEGVTGPEVMLRTVAWGSIVGMAGMRPLGRLRYSLLMAFGIGWLAWLGYVLAPGWGSWGVYQSVRLAGLGLFCWASQARLLVRLV